MPVLTILSPLPPEPRTCGYCGPPGQRSAQETNYHAAECMPMQLSCEAYQRMVDRGWRRSGVYCYKPDLKRSCCPQYTIKLDALKFKPSKSQRKLVNRFNRWVIYDDNIPNAAKSKGKENAFTLDKALHESEYYQCTTLGSEPIHKLEIFLEPSSYTEEKFALYQHYQQEVHKEQEKRPQTFMSFLVESPLHREDIPYTGTPSDLLPRQYGAYHQLYRLDGKLIAMGVIDILPHCVSSVYFMWTHEWERFSLGKLSALRELTLAKEMHDAGAPGMQYLYMGFYIHSCQKMRYKGEYSPSYLADPEEYTWHPLEECRPLLEKYRYASFAHPEHSMEADFVGPEYDPQISESDLGDIDVLISSSNGKGKVAPPRSVKEWRRPSCRHALMAIADGLGIDLAKNVIFYFAHM